MPYKLYFGIAIRIIILVVIGMIGTYIPDQLRGFFGDVPCTGNCVGPDKQWIWGARHYWYFWGMFLLFMLSLVSAVIGIFKLVDNTINHEKRSGSY